MTCLLEGRLPFDSLTVENHLFVEEKGSPSGHFHFHVSESGCVA